MLKIKIKTYRIRAVHKFAMKSSDLCALPVTALLIVTGLTGIFRLAS